MTTSTLKKRKNTQAHNKMTSSLDHEGILALFKKKKKKEKRRTCSKQVGNMHTETRGVKVRERRRKKRISGTLTIFCIIYAEPYTCRRPGVLNKRQRDKGTEVARDRERKRCKERRCTV